MYISNLPKSLTENVSAIIHTDKIDLADFLRTSATFSGVTISCPPKSFVTAWATAVALASLGKLALVSDALGSGTDNITSFESRDVCDAVIKQFNGIPIGEEGMVMNIRYADTPGQKELKRVTAERRQFRTNEYNIGAYGTPLVGIQPNMYNQPAWKRALHATAHT